jgi:hypothetical protein
MIQYKITEDQLRRAGLLVFEQGKPMMKIGVHYEEIEEVTPGVLHPKKI